MSDIFHAAAGYLLGIFVLWGLRAGLHFLSGRNARRNISKWQAHTR